MWNLHPHRTGQQLLHQPPLLLFEKATLSCQQEDFSVHRRKAVSNSLLLIQGGQIHWVFQPLVQPEDHLLKCNANTGVEASLLKIPGVS